MNAKTKVKNQSRNSESTGVAAARVGEASAPGPEHKANWPCSQAPTPLRRCNEVNGSFR